MTHSYICKLSYKWMQIHMTQLEQEWAVEAQDEEVITAKEG